MLVFFPRASLASRAFGLVSFVCMLVTATPGSAQSARQEPPEVASNEQDPAQAYAALHAPRKRRLWLATLEEAAFLGLGATWYYLDKGTNIVDWDNPAWDERFTLDVLRFDNNTFEINFLWHPLSGAAFHASPRANGASMLEASAFTLLTSTAWEYLVEYREKISVNDLIVTPVAGIAFGEFATQLSRYLHRTPGQPTRLQRAAGALFGPMEAIHGARSAGVGGKPDNLGFSADIWHRFNLQTGLALGSPDASQDGRYAAELRAEGEIVAIPSHLFTGSFRRFFHDGDVAALRVRSSVASEVRDVDLYVESILLGYYQQQIKQPQRGHTWLAGFSMAYRYRRMWFETLQDDVGLALGGLSLRSWTRTPRCVIDLGLDVGPGSSGIHSLRFAEWEAQNPEAVGKSILHKRGYSYGFGGYGQLNLAVATEFLRVGARLNAGHFGSKEGLDRTQEELTADIRTVERLLDVEGFLEARPFSRYAVASGFTASLSVLSQSRFSQVADLEAKAQLTRAFFLLGSVF